MPLLTPLPALPSNPACTAQRPRRLPHTRDAGSTDTSLWTHYKAGEREYCGNLFPDGMRKNDRLQQVRHRAWAGAYPLSANQLIPY